MEKGYTQLSVAHDTDVLLCNPNVISYRVATLPSVFNDIAKHFVE